MRTKALASFERSIISARSPYDLYHYGGDDNAVSDAAKRGEILFFNQHLSCFRCHGGFNFTDATISESNAERDIAFHNTGLYKNPSLRNIAITAPYMHDGSVAKLEGVLDRHAAGVQLSQRDRADLIAFLESLTDEAVLHDPRFSDPWPK